MIKPLENNSSILHFNNLENQIWREITSQSDYRLVKDRIKQLSKVENLAMSDSYADQKAKDIQYCIRLCISVKVTPLFRAKLATKLITGSCIKLMIEKDLDPGKAGGIGRELKELYERQVEGKFDNNS